MTMEVSVQNKQVRVALFGSIYVADAARLLENLLGFTDRGHTTFLIDLSEVDYIDSSGLGTLLAIQKRARKNEGGVVIKGMHGLVKEVFELTRMEQLFEIA